MLDALAKPEHRELAWKHLPTIIDMNEPIGPLAEHVALDAGLPDGVRPLVFPTLDDQAAGLIGGGAVDAGTGRDHPRQLGGRELVVRRIAASRTISTP